MQKTKLLDFRGIFQCIVFKAKFLHLDEALEIEIT